MSFHGGKLQLSRGDNLLCQVRLYLSSLALSIVCRAKPKSNVDAKEDWSSVFGFGVMSTEKQVLDEVKQGTSDIYPVYVVSHYIYTLPLLPGHHVWCLRHRSLAGHQDAGKWLCGLDWRRTAHLQPHGNLLTILSRAILRFLFKVWRHTCMSLSRRTGKFKLVENGMKYVEKESEEIIEWMKYVSTEVNFFKSIF